jgi:hypothetical protein
MLVIDDCFSVKYNMYPTLLFVKGEYVRKENNFGLNLKTDILLQVFFLE